MGQIVQKLIIGTKNIQWIPLIVVISVCGLMLTPIGEYWSEGERLLCYAVTSISLLAFGISLFGRNSMPWSWFDTLILLFFLYSLGNAYVLSTTSIAHSSMLFCTCIALYFSLRVLTATWKADWDILVYLLAFVGSMEALWSMGQLLYACFAPTHSGLISGSFINPGPFGCFLAIILSVCTSHYLKHRNKLLGFAIILMLIMLPASWSRTAIIAHVVVLLLLFWKKIKRFWPYILCIGLLLVTGVYFLKQGSADSRMFMNLISIREWTERPWLGHGIGNYISTLAQGQVDYFSANPESEFAQRVGTTSLAFNEYLRIAVEEGLIGLSLYIAIISLALWHLYRQQSPLAYGLIALCIVSLFSYTLSLQAFLLLAVLFAAFSANNREQAEERHAHRIFIVGITSVCVFLGAFFCRLVDSHLQANKCYRGNYVESYYEMLPYKTDNREFLFKFGKVLREMGRYNDSNAILRMSTQLDTDPMAYIVMGRNYEDMNMVTEADSLYQRAFFLQPNRVYPLYRQMKLYESQCDTSRLAQKAEEILGLHTKINSLAVQQMRHEADSIKNKAILPKNLKN